MNRNINSVFGDYLDRANAEVKSVSTQRVSFFTTIKNLIVSFFAFLTVEPYFICYLCASTFTGLPLRVFYVEKACLADLDYSEDVCSKVIDVNSNDNITTKIRAEATGLFLKVSSWKDPLQTGVPAILILFIAAWSDRTGNRKVVLLAPLIGEMFSVLGLMLCNYFITPIWVIGLIEASSAVFTGGLTVAFMGAFCYISDITIAETRTYRIGIVLFIVRFSNVVITPIAGMLTKLIGYYSFFGIALGFYVFGFVYTFLRIKDVRTVETEGTFWDQLCQFFHPSSLWATISILFTSRGIQLAQILLVNLAHMIMFGPIVGENGVTYSYLNTKLNMDAEAFSYYSTFSSLISIIGIMLAITVFIKWLKFHDTVLGLIATTSNVIASMTYALAPNKTWFYAGAAFDIFGGAGGTAVRSLGTKLVNPDQVGKICSLIGLVDSITPSIYSTIFNQVLYHNLQSFPQAVYILGAAMTSPDFIIFSILYILHKRQQRDIVRQPEVKEMHVYDNDITSM